MLSIEWSPVPHQRQVFSPSQVRLYRLLDRVRVPGRGRLKPWTLQSAWHRVLMRTRYYEWRHQTMLDAHMVACVKAIADKVDAEAMKFALDVRQK